MAEATQYVFDFKELAEILIKQQGLHEGLWQIFLKFGLSAGNVSYGGQDLLPTAMVPVHEIGIIKQNEPNSLTVDAAVVNPRPTQTKKGSAKKAK